MTDKIKQTIVKCLRALQDADDPDIYEVAKEMVEEFGYTVEELLEQEPPRKPEWWEQSLPNLNGVLCWVSDHQHTPNSVIAAIICREEETGLFEVKSNKWRYRYATPLTDEEIESFKRGSKSNTEYMKGYVAGQASRDEMIKKLVADNADLSQKRLELIADAQLLGPVKEECEPMQLLGEKK